MGPRKIGKDGARETPENRPVWSWKGEGKKSPCLVTFIETESSVVAAGGWEE